jgi:LDH2 family malate/lactate/ureidoglycolate dehydrogenase
VAGVPVRVAAPALRDLVRDLFCGLDVPEADADAVADALLYANLRGIDSHGIDRAPVYLRRVKAGLAGGTQRMATVAEHGALRRMDAAGALGPAAALRAMDGAIELSALHGVGLVALGGATNIGAAGFYALHAARAGRIALVTTNAPKLMAPHGAAQAFLGSNPLAIAVPMGERDPFVLDMSSTVTARGKIRRAARAGEAIPEGLAIDADGLPTTDAERAMAGSLLPLGGPKGTGLALAMCLLLMLLAEADPDDQAASIYADPDRPQNLGQLLLAIDPWTVVDRERAQARLDALVERLHALRPQPGAGTDAVRYAGEASAARARERAAEGIEVPPADLEAIAAAADECGLPEQAARARALARGVEDLIPQPTPRTP